MNAKEIQLLFQQDTDLRIIPTGIVTNTSVGHPVFTPEELAYKTGTRKRIYNRTENGEDKYINVYYEGHESRGSENRYFKVNGNNFQWSIDFCNDRGGLTSVSVAADKHDDWATHYHANIIEERLLTCPNYSENYEDVDNARESFLKKCWKLGRFGTAAYKALYHMDNKRLSKIWIDIIQLAHNSLADDKPFEMQMITEDEFIGSFKQRQFILQVAGHDIYFSTSEHCVDLYEIIAGSVGAVLGVKQEVEAIIKPFHSKRLNELWIAGLISPLGKTKAVYFNGDYVDYFGEPVEYAFASDAEHDAQLINQIFHLN